MRVPYTLADRDFLLSPPDLDIYVDSFYRSKSFLLQIYALCAILLILSEMVPDVCHHVPERVATAFRLNGFYRKLGQVQAREAYEVSWDGCTCGRDVLHDYKTCVLKEMIPRSRKRF